MSSLGLTVCSGLHSGVLFLGVGFVFFSLYLLEAVSMLQDALACSLGACTLTFRVTDTHCVHCVVGGSVFSPGGSSYWAEACRALGPGDSGLPNSLPESTPKAQREHVPGAGGIGGIDMGMTGGSRILSRERTPNLFCFVKTKE